MCVCMSSSLIGVCGRVKNYTVNKSVINIKNGETGVATDHVIHTVTSHDLCKLNLSVRLKGVSSKFLLVYALDLWCNLLS